MNLSTRSRANSLFIMASVYAFVIAVSIYIGGILPIASPLVKAGVVDLIATLMIFAFSVTFDNSSMYDPYWSVAAIVFVGYWSIPGNATENLTPRTVLVISLLTLWGIRLTYNFLKHWQGLHHEDWRYAEFRDRSKMTYWLVSFLGFHFFPTVIVFVASVPIFHAIASTTTINIIDVIAGIVTMLAILIEATADAQMRAFVKSGAEGTFRGGLWAYSRHPNYFGEVLFWWGMFLFAIAAATANWKFIFGPLAVTMLFLTVSLPLIEKRMKTKHRDYQQICREVSILIPWFPKT